jgi:hypothetical protein
MRLAVVVVRILTEQQHPDLLRRHQPQRVEDVLLWRKDGVRRALGGHECVQLGEIGLGQLVGERHPPGVWDMRGEGGGHMKSSFLRQRE